MRKRFNKLYDDYIISPIWVDKLKSWVEPRFPWTSNIQKYYPWSPINSLWFKLRWFHIDFFSFIHNPYALPTLAVFIVILSFLNIIYLVFLLFFIFYWLIRFLVFLCKPGLEVVKPIKLDLNFKSSVLLLLFIYCVHRPYLVTYSILYRILKYFFSNKSIVNYKVVSVQFSILAILLSIGYLIRYAVGLPLRVVLDAYKWSYKWTSFPLSMYDSLLIKLSERSFSISLWFFDNVQKIERYKVYRVSGNICFNPIKKYTIPIEKTTITHIIKEYVPKFEKEINFVSFKYGNRSIKTPCFRTYHSGDILRLKSGKILLVNFLTKKPQDLIKPFDYTFNNFKTFDVSTNLVMEGNEWKILEPVYAEKNDFRQIYFDKKIFFKNFILHTIYNNDFKQFNPKSDNCLDPLTPNMFSENDSIYTFRKDLFSDSINKDFLYNIDSFETLNNYCISEFVLESDISLIENINPIIPTDDNIN